MEASLFDMLAAGGDVFTMGICIALYKIDVRLRDIESWRKNST